MGAPLPTSPETARQARREYIHALVEQSWARPEATRTVARPHIVLMVAALTAAVALGSGVVAQLIHPVSLPRAAAAGPPSPRALAPFVAVAGWDCPQSGDRGFDIAGRSADWRTVAHGGWAENGCHGTFEAIPISADRSSDGTEQGAVWWFAPPAGLTRCEVAVFRPRPDHPGKRLDQPELRQRGDEHEQPGDERQHAPRHAPDRAPSARRIAHQHDGDGDKSRNRSRQPKLHVERRNDEQQHRLKDDPDKRDPRAGAERRFLGFSAAGADEPLAHH